MNSYTLIPTGLWQNFDARKWPYFTRIGGEGAKVVVVLKQILIKDCLA